VNNEYQNDLTTQSYNGVIDFQNFKLYPQYKKAKKNFNSKKDTPSVSKYFLRHLRRNIEIIKQ
jgi:hypothetical protein